MRVKMSDQLVVFIASPFAGDVEANITYARAATLDSLRRGEAPYAPHLLYPQVLDGDDVPEDRRAGMRAGVSVLARCDLFAVYEDLGISSGMRSEITYATEHGIRIEKRRIGDVLNEPVTESPTRSSNVAEIET
jgi:hypothetical protein